MVLSNIITIYLSDVNDQCYLYVKNAASRTMTSKEPRTMITTAYSGNGSGKDKYIRNNNLWIRVIASIPERVRVHMYVYLRLFACACVCA